MKKRFILMPVVGAFVCFLLSGYSYGPGLAGLGDRTGATAGAGGCGSTGCHGTTTSTNITVTMQLMSSTSVVTSYTPGASYNVVLTGVRGATTASALLTKFGFQLSAVKTSATSTNAGTLSATTSGSPTHVGVYGGISIVEHGPATPTPGSSIPMTSGTGGAGTTYVITIPWVAPVAGTGSVTFFSILNAVNANGGADVNDLWNYGSLVVPEVAATVGPITGVTTLCAGATSTLSNATSGGGWLSGNTTVATIGSLTGVVTGVSAGSSVITYGTSVTSFTTATVTVLGAPSAILGGSSPCVGASATLSDATPGGTWSSTNTSVATIGTSGIVTGVSGGATIISYTNSAGCAATTTLTINSGTPTAIAGPSVVCVGTTITLSNGVSGGTWTSSNTAKATIGATSGLVTGVAVGSSTITYKVVNACGTGTVTSTVNVHAAGTCSTSFANLPTISGAELSVFPNPNAGSFMVNLLSDNVEMVHVTISNMVGSKVAEFVANSNHETEVRINQPSGIYILTATTERGSYVARIVIQ